MTFTISFSWWWIPTAISLAGLAWTFAVERRGDVFGGIFELAISAFVSAVAWAIAGALK